MVMKKTKNIFLAFLCLNLSLIHYATSCIDINLLLDQQAEIEAELFFNEFLFGSNCCDLLEGNISRSNNKKPWTFMVYMAADNDLHPFAATNMKQMAAIGSNHNVNIVIHFDVKLNGSKKISRRYLVEKERFVPAAELPVPYMDSGDPKTLSSFVEWAVNKYPAHNYALILWNHGTGIIDPKYNKIINPAELFTFNPSTNKLELDRSSGFLDLLFNVEHQERGICWDNTTGNYLTNKKFETALQDILYSMNGQKLSLIGFDACLMAMLEVANLVKKYADVMVASEEVELGTGWNYTQVLSALAHSPIDKYAFAKHIVAAYENVYNHITNDYTQSAINLDQLALLEQNVHRVSLLISECLAQQKNYSVKEVMKTSRDKKTCTHFDEPTYVDLHHLYCNIQDRLQFMQLTTNPSLVHQLNAALNEGKQLISTVAFASVAGKSLHQARGISIYFPEKFIHSSYATTPFAQTNAWHTLLMQLLS